MKISLKRKVTLKYPKSIQFVCHFNYLFTLLCQNSWFQSLSQQLFILLKIYRSPPNQHKKYNKIYINITSLSTPVTNIYFLFFFSIKGQLNGVRTLTIDMQTISTPLFFLRMNTQNTIQYTWTSQVSSFLLLTFILFSLFQQAWSAQWNKNTYCRLANHWCPFLFLLLKRLTSNKLHKINCL